MKNTCAICGVKHYEKTTTFIDWYEYKNGERVLSFNLPFGTSQLCKKCSSKVKIEMINDGRAYLAKEMEG